MVHICVTFRHIVDRWLIHSKFLSRHACLVPNAVFHSSTRDFEYNGYKIPKDTVLISSLYHVMYDHENFKDPEIFRPERYNLCLIGFHSLTDFSQFFQVYKSRGKICQQWKGCSIWHRQEVLSWTKFSWKRILFVLQRNPAAIQNWKCSRNKTSKLFHWGWWRFKRK